MSLRIGWIFLSDHLSGYLLLYRFSAIIKSSLVIGCCWPNNCQEQYLSLHPSFSGGNLVSTEKGSWQSVDWVIRWEKRRIKGIESLISKLFHCVAAVCFLDPPPLSLVGSSSSVCTRKGYWISLLSYSLEVVVPHPPVLCPSCFLWALSQPSDHFNTWHSWAESPREAVSPWGSVEESMNELQQL